jgi:hypothetical protein
MFLHLKAPRLNRYSKPTMINQHDIYVKAAASAKIGIWKTSKPIPFVGTLSQKAFLGFLRFRIRRILFFSEVSKNSIQKRQKR